MTKTVASLERSFRSTPDVMNAFCKCLIYAAALQMRASTAAAAPDAATPPGALIPEAKLPAAGPDRVAGRDLKIRG